MSEDFDFCEVCGRSSDECECGEEELICDICDNDPCTCLVEDDAEYNKLKNKGDA